MISMAALHSWLKMSPHSISYFNLCPAMLENIISQAVSTETE